MTGSLADNTLSPETYNRVSSIVWQGWGTGSYRPWSPLECRIRYFVPIRRGNHAVSWWLFFAYGSFTHDSSTLDINCNNCWVRPRSLDKPWSNVHRNPFVPYFVANLTRDNVLGLVIVPALVCQAFLGYYHHYRFIKDRPLKRRWFTYFHIWSGIILIFLGILNCGSGLDISHVAYKYVQVWWAFCAILPLSYGAAAVLKCYLDRRKHSREMQAIPEELANVAPQASEGTMVQLEDPEWVAERYFDWVSGSRVPGHVIGIGRIMEYNLLVDYIWTTISSWISRCTISLFYNASSSSSDSLSVSPILAFRLSDLSFCFAFLYASLFAISLWISSTLAANFPVITILLSDALSFLFNTTAHSSWFSCWTMELSAVMST